MAERYTENVDDIFRMHDEYTGAADITAEDLENIISETKSETFSDTAVQRDTGDGKKTNPVDRIFISGNKKEKTNYTGDRETERDFRPIRRSREYRSGIMGGLMYFTFVMCAGILLACFLWMCASDALALNKSSVSAVINLPSSVFTKQTVDVYDDDGNFQKTKDVLYADIDYVASTLKESGIIEYKWLFQAFCSLSNAQAKIDPGNYELKSTLDYRAIIKAMQSGSGQAVTIKVMIPEGYTMHQIFTLLEEKEVCSYDELMDAAANSVFNYSFIDETMAGDASRLEGYLFPDTYEFYVGMQASSAINKLLSNFYNRLTADMQKQASDRGMSINQIVIIASLIEKEAKVDSGKDVDERATVSSVIYNRLEQNMALGLESSILYIHPEHEGAPTASMLSEDSPYNTNINAGLPPTPICNPSLAAIQAALNPENTDYLFFIYDESIEHSVFFRTYEEFTQYSLTMNGANENDE